MEQEQKKGIEEMARVIAASRNSRCIKNCPDCSLDGNCMWQEIANALYFEGYRKQSQVKKEILDLVPEKMIAETVRFDSAHGVSKALGVSLEEAEELKDKYNKLQKMKEECAEE